jgi:hypothetical protein
LTRILLPSRECDSWAPIARRRCSTIREAWRETNRGRRCTATSWYHFGTGCIVRYVLCVPSRGRKGRMGRLGTHLTDLSAGWGPSGRWFKSSRPDQSPRRFGASMKTASPSSSSCTTRTPRPPLPMLGSAHGADEALQGRCWGVEGPDRVRGAKLASLLAHTTATNPPAGPLGSCRLRKRLPHEKLAAVHPLKTKGASDG